MIVRRALKELEAYQFKEAKKCISSFVYNLKNHHYQFLPALYIISLG